MVVEQGGGRHEEVPSFNQIKESVDLALEKDLMSCAVLEGPPEEAILMHCAILLRQLPETGLVEFNIFLNEKNRFTEDEVDYRLNNLTVAPFLQSGEDSLIILRHVSEVLAEGGTPLIMLLMGESEKTEQEMAVIYVAKGMTIARALTTLQDANRKANEIKQQN